MNGFFCELQRRKVYRVAAGYAVASWVIIQVAGVTFPALGLPLWSLRLVIVLALAGFPMALVLAWAFDVGSPQTEIQPESPSAVECPPGFAARRKNIFALAVFGLVVSLLAGFFLLPRASANKLDKSIAVLPFASLSDDKENAHFADGIQDDVLTNLAKIGDLKVVSRTSVMPYRGTTQSVREIGKALGVSAILEGSVRRVGNRVRVTVELINAANDRHIWAEDYDRDVTDVFALQAALASEIAAQLKAKLSPNEQAQIARKPTQNGEAYLLYLQAHDLFTRPDRQAGDLAKAEQLYEQAIHLDPSFALAFAQMAYLESWIYHDFEPTPQRLDRARAAANEAIRLQPDLPESHRALGWNYYYGDRNYERALAEFATARRGLPNDGEISVAVAAILRRQGKWQQSSAEFERAAVLNPRDPLTLENLARNYRALRNYPLAAKTFDRAAALAPNSFDVIGTRAWVDFEWKGDLTRIQNLLTKLPESFDPDGMVTLARYNVKLYERKFDEALELLRRSPRDNLHGETSAPLPKSFLAAHVYWVMNDQARARAAYEEARVVAEQAVRESPLDGARHALLGLIYAGLDQKADAIREGARAVELLPESKDALDGPILVGSRARIHAAVGDPEMAISLLEHLVAIPAGITVHELRLDPTWDSLRGNPRFQQMLAEFSAKP